MIFNPTRGGGSEKKYTITVRSDKITLSVTKQKPGHVFQAEGSRDVKGSLKMSFKDPDTGKLATIQGAMQALSNKYDFVMPCADVTIFY